MSDRSSPITNSSRQVKYFLISSPKSGVNCNLIFFVSMRYNLSRCPSQDRTESTERGNLMVRKIGGETRSVCNPYIKGQVGSDCFSTGLVLPLLVVSNIKLNINTHSNI